MKVRVLFAVLFGLFFSLSLQAQVLYVNHAASGNNDGTSWADAYVDLQTAINAASKGDYILVAKGTYYPSMAADGKSTDARDKAFVLKDSVFIYGGYAGNELYYISRKQDSTSLYVTNATILSGDLGKKNDSTDNAYHVVISSGLSSFILNGFTIQGGNADGTTPIKVNGRNIYRHYAGGVYNDSTSGEYKNIIVRNNTANSFDDEEGGGGGMFNYKGAPVIDSVRFYYNHAENCNGGAMKNDASSPKITACYFVKNVSFTDDEGGGAVNNRDNSNAIFKNCYFVGNSTNGSGGAIYNDGSSPQFTNVEFHDNSAGDCGGGMDADGGSDIVLTNVLFKNNYAAEDGGGLYAWKSSPTVINGRFIENKADNNGGGMYCYNTCNPIITNSIFHKNDAANDYGGFGLERNSTAIVTNSLFSRNHAANNGGGLGSHDNHGSKATIIATNLTIVKNKAKNGGGGYDYGKTSQFRNSIAVDNYPDDVDIEPSLILFARNIITSNGSNDVFIADGSVNPYGTTVSGPYFKDTANDNYMLLLTSVAIDKGDSSFFNTSKTPDLSSIKTDLAGFDRIAGKNIDIGAYEDCGSRIVPTVVMTMKPDTNIYSNTTITFSLDITDGGPNPEIKWWRNGVLIAGESGKNYVGRADTNFISGDTIWATVRSSEYCASAESFTSNAITLDFCSKIIVPTYNSISSSIPYDKIFAGTKVTFAVHFNNGGSHPEIKWWINDKVVQTSQDTLYSGIADTDFHSGDSIWVTVKNTDRCGFTNEVGGQIIYLDYCSKLIVPTAKITSSVSGEISSGTQVDFTVELHNAGSHPEIKWWKNGIEIPMANDTIYSAIADKDFISTDSIWATVRNTDKCGSPDSSRSNALVVGICSKTFVPTAILSYTVTDEILGGTKVKFSLDLTDAGSNPEIKWWKNGVEITSAHDTVYTGIADTDFHSGDSIWATVRNTDACGSPDSSSSNVITLDYCSGVIVPMAALHSTPVDSLISKGTDVTFSLNITNGGSNPEIKWWKNGIEIPMSNDSIYIGKADTDFMSGDSIWATVRNTDKCGSHDSFASNMIVLDYISTGINTPMVSAIELNVFPNPNNGSFILKGNFNNHKEYALSIVDIAGRNIHHEIFKGATSNKEIKLSHSIQPGIYFLTVYQKDEGSKTIRIMLK